MATNTKIVQTPSVTLYTSVAAADVTLIITPYPVDLDGNNLAMSDFGAIGYATIDPKVSGYEEIISFTGLINNGDGTATLTGLTRDLQSKYPYTGTGSGKQHGSSAIVVFSNNPQLVTKFTARDNDEVITGQWTFSVFPITPSTPLATATSAGMTQLSVAPVDPLHPIAVGANDTTIFAPASAGVPTGAETAFTGLTIPASWLAEDGSAVSRSMYANLWAALHKSVTFTVTIASPGVFSATGHGLTAGLRIRLYTTGILPTGLTANTDYFVIATGLTANAFELSLAPGGTAINTTGSQSGVHTFVYAPFGHGDGSTTFHIPDRRGRTIVGSGTGVKTMTIISVSGNVITANMSVNSNNEFQTGEAVVFTAVVAGNLTTATTYYLVRVTNNSFSVATSLANAQAGTLVTLAGTETGSFALTLTARNLGETGGEENHSQSLAELAIHNHTIPVGGAGNALSTTSGSGGMASTTGTAGSNTPANVMQPFGVSQWIIKT